jgi:hypothetical protein
VTLYLVLLKVPEARDNVAHSGSCGKALGDTDEAPEGRHTGSFMSFYFTRHARHALIPRPVSPLPGFMVISDAFPTVSTVGYVVTSLRDFRLHGIGSSPGMTGRCGTFDLKCIHEEG